MKRMAWHGTQEDNTDFGQDLHGYSCNISPHFHYDTPQHSTYTFPTETTGLYINEKQSGNFYSSNGGGCSAPSYVQFPVVSFQPPVRSVQAAPRVHINPNYRPKVLVQPKTEVSSTRPASVHINPHWKPRLEPTGRKESKSQIESCINQTVGKKTIFVNPKVLAHINVKGPSPSIEMGLVPKKHSIHAVPDNDGVSIPTAATNDQSKKANVEDAKCLGNTKCIEPASASNCSFIVLTSKKLIRKPNMTTQQKPLNVPVLPSKTQVSIMEENCKRYSPPCVSSLKTARQVSSKYKLVCNPTSALNTTNKGLSTQLSRRPRRKSVNSKTSSTPQLKSLYKFIRKAGVGDSAASAVKTPRKSVNTTSFPSQNSWRGNLNDAAKGCSNTGARRNVKTRYRLVKLHPREESVSRKSMQSRYKIVRQGFTGLKSSAQMNNSPVCGFPLYSSLVRSKFKSLVNKNYQGRKVSRFRITQTSKSRLKTQSLLKISNSHLCPKHVKPIFPRTGLSRNIIWQKDQALPSILPSIGCSILASIDSKKKRDGSHSAMKISNRSLVNIGGVLYRSTRTSLTRTHTAKSKERIVLIRGKRYVMDGKGKTLRPTTGADDGVEKRVENDKMLSIARVDIGGVTFTRRSDNTLVRTNTHYARNLLSIAKTRSIARLTDKLRKNNQPCLIYHRFGKCRAQEERKCWRVHDPKNIAICRKFLQGCCEAEKCLLSHNVGPEKMPTCRYFLEGCCVRDNCPYLHVKLSSHAAICQQFLHGYCAAGDMCKKRHVHLCPDFERDGKCKKGKYCPFPHKTSTKPKSKVNISTLSAKDPCSVMKKKHGKASPSSSGETEKTKRYYDENRDRKIEQPHGCKELDSDASNLLENISPEETDILQKTPKLGILPSYIPL